MRNDLILEDTTLRDGEQAPGMAFTKEQKSNILDRLIAAGVTHVEVGIPAMGGEELEFLKSVVERQEEARLVAWNRGVRADIEQSLDLGFRSVHMGLPASDLHLAKSVGRDRKWLLSTARDLVHYAKDRGAFVSISAEDVGRADPGFLVEYAHTVHEAGADRLRMSDTIGILGPEAYGERIGKIARECEIDMQCHAHNDFGLGVANTMAGLQAGARYFHVTVNGIGERAGMADLAQMATALKYIYDVDLGIDLTQLTLLSRTVAEAAGHPAPPWHPVVGENVFAHESGIHVNAMLKDTSSFEPINPEAVGGERRYILGKHSGRALIRSLLEENGKEYDDELLSRCLSEVRTLAMRQGSAVETAQLLEIHKRAIAGRSLT